MRRGSTVTLEVTCLGPGLNHLSAVCYLDSSYIILFLWPQVGPASQDTVTSFMTLSEPQFPSAHRVLSLALSPCSPLEGPLMDQLWAFLPSPPEHDPKRETLNFTLRSSGADPSGDVGVPRGSMMAESGMSQLLVILIEDESIN